MTSPAVVPIAAGETPTEPGWYVAKPAACAEGDLPEIVQVEKDGRGELAVNIVGSEGCLPLWDYSFIARIYPELIGESQA
ncbi:hypothetical protein [Methylobacterium sp. CM6257]|jgi:hypothetical protein